MSDVKGSARLRTEDWGLTDYQRAFELQAQMVDERLQGRGRDTLILTEHPQTVTLGRRGSAADLRYPELFYGEQGIFLQRVNRGGLATAHEPGQLVAYPILVLQTKDLHLYIQKFLQVVVTLLADYGLQGQLKAGEPGIWVNDRKICSFGIALKKWITSHGIALNINNNLETFGMIVPCGKPDESITSLSRELQMTIDLAQMKSRFVDHFCRVFDYQLDPKG